MFNMLLTHLKAKVYTTANIARFELLNNVQYVNDSLENVYTKANIQKDLRQFNVLYINDSVQSFIDNKMISSFYCHNPQF